MEPATAPLEDSDETFLVRTVASFKTTKRDEISFKKNQKILVTKTDQKQFRYFGKLENGKEGTVTKYKFKNSSNEGSNIKILLLLLII